MYDLTIAAPHGAESLAEIGKVLGGAGVGLDGGGMWGHVAHYLVAEPQLAAEALATAAVELLGVHEVLLVPLREDVPGELGRIMSRLAEVGVRLDVQYSDHRNRKVLVVDDREAAVRALS
jgi:hypothetical protein